MKNLLELSMQENWSSILPTKLKRDGFINLSSNTLQHPGIFMLHKEFFSTTDFSKYCYAYPDYEELREYFSERFKLSHNNVGFVGGTDSLIAALFEAAANLNLDKVFLQTPYFYNYMNYAKCCKLSVELLGFKGILHRLTLEKLSKAKPTFIFLTSPCPLTGEVLAMPSLSEWISEVEKYGHFVILDQAYSGFGSELHFQLLNQHENLFIFQTLSKAYGGAGFRFGFYAGYHQFISRLRSVGVENSVSTLSVHYAKFALEHEQEFANLRNDIAFWRERAYSYLKKNFTKFHYFDSQANFISFDTGDIALASNIVEALATNKIFLKKQFYPFSGYLRITVAQPHILNHLFSIIQNEVPACID